MVCGGLSYSHTPNFQKKVLRTIKRDEVDVRCEIDGY